MTYTKSLNRKVVKQKKVKFLRFTKNHSSLSLYI